MFIFTDANDQADKPLTINSKGVLSDYVSESHRWDQRVFLFIMSSPSSAYSQQSRGSFDDSDAAAADDNSVDHNNFFPKQEKLATLCARTGGEVFVCKSMKDAQNSMRALFTKLHASPASVGIKFSVVEKDGLSSELSPPSLSFARLVVKIHGEWPIPEAGWVNHETESLPVRHSLPLLSLVKDKASIASTRQMYQIAKELDLLSESYEVVGIVSRALILAKDEMYPVFVRGSCRTDVDYPFAILAPGKVMGSLQLIVLPFNYHDTCGDRIINIDEIIGY